MHIKPIAHIETPFSQKFGIPRQGNLAAGVLGIIRFEPEFCNPDYLRGIEQFSHLWITFGFHQHEGKQPSPLVRPPRLGGNKKLGVFATRSSFRPNGLGLSVVEIKGVQSNDNQLILKVAGVDMLNHTPVFDIKPYIPYADAFPQALSGFAANEPQRVFSVSYSNGANQELAIWQMHYPQLPHILKTVLEADPRPAYKANNADPKHYKIQLFDLDIEWKVEEQLITVLSIQQI